MKPILAARQRESSPSRSRSMRAPATWISPASGRSIPPTRLSSVVLPDPEGPITATKSACGIARSRRSKTAIVSLPFTKRFATPARRAMTVSECMRVSCRFTAMSVGGSRLFRRRAAVFEGHLDGHVGKDARVLFLELDAHLDGGLFTVGRRHDGDDRGGDGPVRIRVEHGRNSHAGL